ncbi:MAG: PD40 domain-containing protein [Flammeovirgaceae bacterium]|nr:PD40 domain-containing protein [Flammeovirgaceae bacterium]
MYKDCDPVFSPDGRRIYFISTRPKNAMDTFAQYYYSM